MPKKFSSLNQAINRDNLPEGSAISVGKNIYFDPTREWTEQTIQLFISRSAPWQSRSHALWWIWYHGKASTWPHQDTEYARKNELIGKPYKGFEDFCNNGQAKFLTAPTGYRYLKIACSPRYRELYDFDIDTRYIIRLAALQDPKNDEFFNYLTWSVSLGVKPQAIQPILDLAKTSQKQAIIRARQAYFDRRKKIIELLEILPH